MIPVYFLVRSEPWETKTLITVGIAAFSVVFTNYFLNTMVTVTESMNLDYGSVFSNNYFLEDDGSSPIRTLIYAVPTIMAFTQRDTIRREAPDLIKVCVNMSIVCVCVSAIANVTSGIYVGRLPIYFSMYNLILLPYLFIHTDVKNRGWILPVMLMYIALFIYENYFYGHPYYYSEFLGLMVR